MTPKNDAIVRKDARVPRTVQTASDELLRCNQLTSSPKKKGSKSKPTPRSETARLRSNVFRGFGNDEVFLSAWIVTLFKMMALIARKALKTLLTMYNDLKFSSSELVGWYCIKSSQIVFFILLNVFNRYGVLLELNNPYELLGYLSRVKNEKFDKIFSNNAIT